MFGCDEAAYECDECKLQVFLRGPFDNETSPLFQLAEVTAGLPEWTRRMRTRQQPPEYWNGQPLLNY